MLPVQSVLLDIINVHSAFTIMLYDTMLNTLKLYKLIRPLNIEAESIVI